jgi:hypothetical protein
MLVVNIEGVLIQGGIFMAAEENNSRAGLTVHLSVSYKSKKPNEEMS